MNEIVMSKLSAGASTEWRKGMDIRSPLPVRVPVPVNAGPPSTPLVEPVGEDLRVMSLPTPEAAAAAAVVETTLPSPDAASNDPGTTIPAPPGVSVWPAMT